MTSWLENVSCFVTSLWQQNPLDIFYDPFFDNHSIVECKHGDIEASQVKAR